MQVKPSSFNSRIPYFLGAIFLLILTGCNPTPPPSTAAPAEDVLLNIAIDTPAPPNENTGELLVKYRIDCFCMDDSIRAILTLTPLNGRPPYIIPGFEFVESQPFGGALGDVYSITIESSDDPPLNWKREITLECNPIPACPTLPSPTEESSRTPAVEHPPIDESLPPANESLPPSIPDCLSPGEGAQPPGRGGIAPGLCKKD